MTELFQYREEGDTAQAVGRTWGIAGTNGLGITTNKGLWSNFMLPKGLTLKPYKAAYALVPPGD